MTEEKLFASVAKRLEALARNNAVVGEVTGVGGRHAIPLVEVSLGLGGGGGAGEGDDPNTGSHGKGQASGAGGGAKVTPVAVIVVENGTVKLETLGH